ncbi:hypothetical protein D3Z38_16535 [Clostridiales bacterium]|nr:hypothetical protein [Clostridiales bacterium]
MLLSIYIELREIHHDKRCALLACWFRRLAQFYFTIAFSSAKVGKQDMKNDFLPLLLYFLAAFYDQKYHD